MTNPAGGRSRRGGRGGSSGARRGSGGNGRPAVGASGRRSARERTLGLLYEAETKGEDPNTVLDAQPIVPDSFTVEVVRGVAECQADLDVLIGRVAQGWRIERMPVVDRVVLRMGAYELCHRPDVPAAAAISEAVELAKKFSTDNSGRFVNGVLARIASEYRPQDDDLVFLELTDLSATDPDPVLDPDPDPEADGDETALGGGSAGRGQGGEGEGLGGAGGVG